MVPLQMAMRAAVVMLTVEQAQAFSFRFQDSATYLDNVKSNIQCIGVSRGGTRVDEGG